MEIKELAAALEQKINERVSAFNDLAKSVQKLEAQIDQHIKAMATIYKELEPVHTLVHISNPHIETLGKEVLELAGKKRKK